MRTSFLLILALVMGAAVGLLPERANASGFYLHERGVRSLGRGGAYVAGAQGAESLWINPAGLKDSGESFRMEGTMTFFRGSFTRLGTNPETGEQYEMPQVDMKTTPLPMPLFGLTKQHGAEDWTFGYAFYIPTFGLYTWNDNVNGAPAPNRYSLYSIKGSILGNFAAGLAWHGVEGLSIGASAAVITGRFKASMALSACDGFICNDAEDPAFDATAVITLRRFASVMVGAGMTYELGPVKIGGSFQTPWNLGGKRTNFDVTLPSHPLFADAKVDGDTGKIKIPFPWIGRVGLEFKAGDSFKMEVAGVYEGWSRQQEITATANDMWIRNVFGIGDYQVGTIKIPRLMSNAYSFRGGFELFSEDMGMTFRMGASYDTTAIKDKALSPLTLDANKIVAGIGLTLHVGSVFDMDIVYGHVFLPDRTVRNSEISQPTAIRPPQPDPADRSYIGNGSYTMEADYIGLGSTFHL